MAAPRARLWTASALLSLASVAACGGAQLQVAALDDMERVRGAAAAKEGNTLAPEAYARGEQERRIALEDHSRGDDVGATLHAQRAVAAYEHAFVVARLARAMTEMADAQRALDDATAQAQDVEASRVRLEREAAELEDRVRIARERLVPAGSAPATADRERARLVAARALGLEARLLCDAARLVASDVPADLTADAAKLDDRLVRGAHPAPIDEAARLRSRCLDVLTKTRRAASADGAGSSDALLTELSASGGWDPVRDERGVIVTLHDAFRGADIAPEAAERLKQLGQVAAAHPGFALQLVVHDALPPNPKDEVDAKRAAAAAGALTAAGATAARMQTELAGARAPLVDPADARQRARNERLDVVFVASAK
jgi:hypothetical protein